MYFSPIVKCISLKLKIVQGSRTGGMEEEEEEDVEEDVEEEEEEEEDAHVRSGKLLEETIAQ